MDFVQFPTTTWSIAIVHYHINVPSLLQFNRSELRDFCVYTRPLSIIFGDIDVGLSRVIIRSVVVHMLRGMACRIPAVLLVFYCVSELCRQYFNVSNIFDVDTVKIRDDYVGIFGNADPLDVSQWRKIDVQAAASNTATWQERTGICKNAVTTMNYRLIPC
mmetsp:Transcript_9411/g.32320  ORF Transcript_9411/g.32320 Transcript_9411/m.32320 type:complete len:161 (+) Transcript_9411:2444-2926(+)